MIIRLYPGKHNDAKGPEMTSSLPPHPTDADLLAWLNGDNTHGEHISHCHACLERVRTLSNEEQFLRINLYRTDCPSAHELGEYELRMLPQFQLNAITVHVAHCPHCSQELATLREFFMAVALHEVQSTIAERVRVVVATLLRDAQAGWQGMGGMQPALAAMRGEQNKPRIYEADDYQLTLDIQEDPENPGRRALFGLLIGDDAPMSFEIQLWQGDTLITHAPVDEFGNFSIKDLMNESYNLKLVKPELEIRLDALRL